MEKFSPNNNGVRRVVEKFFTTERIDSYRKPDKPREELWTRFDLAIEDLLPGAYPLPSWSRAVAGLSHEEAAAKLNALRQPAGPNEYFRLRQKEREEKERAEAAEADADAEAAIALDQLARTPEEPHVMSRDDIRHAREKRERMAKATRSKVSADKKNAASAESWAKKVVSRMDRA